MTDLLTLAASRRHAPTSPTTRPNWKPEGCADCGLLHPSFSLNGAHGPWRCADCHQQAKEARRG